MTQVDSELGHETRERLACKRRLLYTKSCTGERPDACLEGLVRYHLGRREIDVLHDLLAFLDALVETLRHQDSRRPLRAAEDLTARIRGLLEAAMPAPRTLG